MGRVLCILLAAALLAAPATAPAEKGGKGKQEGRKGPEVEGAKKKGRSGTPPGWSRGLKTGWGGETLPPGAREWSTEQKREWKKDLENARSRVQERAGRIDGFGEPDLQSALLSLDAMAGQGVPVDDGLALVERLMDREMKGGGIESVTRAMAFGVSEGFKAGRINSYINDRLNEGLMDDALGSEIYRAIDRRLAP